MANAPHIEITGNLTADPEYRFTPGGHGVCNFTVAVTPRKKIGPEWEDGDPQFWNVTAWKTLGENVAASLMRGDPVTVIGRVDFREYVSRDGEKRHAHEVTADVVSVPLTFHEVRVKRAVRKPAANTPSKEENEDASNVPF